MVVTWYGGQCLLVEERLRGEAPRSILFYPETKTSRARTLEEKANVIIASGSRGSANVPYRITVPGEYDIAGFSIRGVSLAKGRTIAYIVESADVTLCYLSTGVERLGDKEIEALGVIDILAITVSLKEKSSQPASGLGDLVHGIEPRLVLPLLSDEKVRAVVRKELGADGESLPKLAVSPRDFPEEGFRVVYLSVQ